MDKIDIIFQAGVAVILILAMFLNGVRTINNDNKNAQAICELQRSADSCFQILNR